MTHKQEHPLHRARLLRKLTLQQLAEQAEMSLGGICKIEIGEVRNPHKFTKRALAQALAFEVADIWPAEGKLPHPDLRPSQGRGNGRAARTRNSTRGKA